MLDGYLATHAIPGSYDAEEFYNFIAEEVVSMCFYVSQYLSSRCVISFLIWIPSHNLCAHSQ